MAEINEPKGFFVIKAASEDGENLKLTYRFHELPTRKAILVQVPPPLKPPEFTKWWRGKIAKIEAGSWVRLRVPQDWFGMPCLNRENTHSNLPPDTILELGAIGDRSRNSDNLD